MTSGTAGDEFCAVVCQYRAIIMSKNNRSSPSNPLSTNGLGMSILGQELIKSSALKNSTGGGDEKLYSG